MPVIEAHIDAPRFSHATDVGEVVEQSGYHQPNEGRMVGRRGCGCKLTTRKGAYRDVTVEMPDGRVVHFYHQSPVVVEHDGRYRLDSCGYNTRTTKQRIKQHLPRGYSIRQRDYEWEVTSPDGEVLEFEDGMVILAE